MPESPMNQKSKILLILPSHPLRCIAIPPMGLGYLATAIRTKTNWDVSILNALRDNLTLEETLNEIQAAHPQVVGFQMFSRDFHHVSYLIEKIKEMDPSIQTFAGGPHPSSIPKHTLESIPSLDYIITAEAEDSLVAYLNEFKNGHTDVSSFPGFVYRNSTGEIIQIPRDTEMNIDVFGMPAWDLMDPRTYPHSPHGGLTKFSPTAPIIVTRGCPYACTYCAAHLLTGKKFGGVLSI